ncbi:homeobox protein DLX-3-like [Helianthus annuus]|uniref:homeobox protein DLX-3-like n=1 Tax=Helianthus annuus TaxID=4232 RepID=UPI0016533238|nr:homeobox protein DLX-3-like [Helianthus annuus]
MQIEPDLISRIKDAQKQDGELWAIVQNLEVGKQSEFSIDHQGVIWCGKRLCVPDDSTLRESLLAEAHSSPFSIHPGSTKMYRDLRQNFWWNGMKEDVARYVSKCLTCQQVKIEHKRASGLLQPLDIPIWKHKPKMEGNGNQRAREEVPATTSDENENCEVRSSDEEEINRGDSSSSSRQYSHYTREQVEELEKFFKKNPHPTEKERTEIANKLNITINKVKFWFQNRRTQLKSQKERSENVILKQENEQQMWCTSNNTRRVHSQTQSRDREHTVERGT